MVIPHEMLERLMPYHLFVEPEAELTALLSIFESTGAASFLEVGTNRGFTSTAIAVAFPTARVVTLDLPDPTSTQWNPLPRAQVGDAHRALGVAQRIEQRWMDSAQMWRFAGKGEVYDLIFIDGDNSPGAVFRDLILAADLLPKGKGLRNYQDTILGQIVMSHQGSFGERHNLFSRILLSLVHSLMPFS